jgi:hypothetical protein
MFTFMAITPRHFWYWKVLYLGTILPNSSLPFPAVFRWAMLRLNIVLGYTILVLGISVILFSFSTVASIIIVIPVPVIMELDGISSNPSKLGEAAQEAVA